MKDDNDIGVGEGEEEEKLIVKIKGKERKVVNLDALNLAYV